MDHKRVATASNSDDLPTPESSPRSMQLDASTSPRASDGRAYPATRSRAVGSGNSAKKTVFAPHVDSQDSSYEEEDNYHDSDESEYKKK